MLEKSLKATISLQDYLFGFLELLEFELALTESQHQIRKQNTVSGKYTRK